MRNLDPKEVEEIVGGCIGPILTPMAPLIAAFVKGFQEAQDKASTSSDDG